MSPMSNPSPPQLADVSSAFKIPNTGNSTLKGAPASLTVSTAFALTTERAQGRIGAVEHYASGIGAADVAAAAVYITSVGPRDIIGSKKFAWAFDLLVFLVDIGVLGRDEYSTKGN
eukprot:CAMPEP_0172309846 /NCGR_PEP_ID=MMETSP1058-20130122/10744_1 /TAXON_ID=83371 /ORGANISM="Detonula confervacea, Strain CCMP 353" /LENGTH=115 /DNA_ID=CAMNT_0013022547 /DNA_START=352 /DNA_END=698 /DNA_ORIENTATION=-